MGSTIAPPAGGTSEPTGAWVVGFTLTVLALQMILMVPAASPARLLLRSAGFAASLAMIFAFPRLKRSWTHPAAIPAMLAVGWVAISLFHPETNTFRSGLATIAMYLAIVAPLLWVRGMAIDESWLRRLLVVMWGFAALSALVGVGQTLKPEWRWLQPNLSAVVQNTNDGGESLKISLASGAEVLRPMGLSDQPGAAAMAGLTCIVFGLAILSRRDNFWVWAVCLPAMVMGLYCILLSQIRSVLIMAGVCVTALAAILVYRKDFGRALRVLIAISVIAVVGAAWAVTIGGETVTRRLATLIEEDPRQVYYQNRGRFVEYTYAYALPRWPLGAGLGRWGMMNYYFGVQDDPDSDVLWAEIQWTSWTYDGGFPLIALYSVAVGVAVWQAWKLAVARGNGDIGLWAGVIFAFDIGCVAVTFNYPLFMGQFGMDFWMLNAALFGAAAFEARRRANARAAQPPPGFEGYTAPRSTLGMGGWST